jgi:hypothetical protein
MPEFEHWESFYVIVGAAAGALIGLQFVVLTLIAENPPPRSAEAAPVFVTPTIVHFSVALALSALLRMPFESISTLAIFCALVGLLGLVYATTITVRMCRQRAYQADLEDWLAHSAIPLLVYATLVGCSALAFSHAHEALFGYAGVTLALLFLGIHNAWDSIAFHVYRNIIGAGKTENNP